MEKRKLNYWFHNPNSVADTADYLLKILMEANMGKVQAAIQENVNALYNNQENFEGGHST